VDGDLSAVGFDQGANHVEAEAQALAGGTGAEGLEDPAALVGGMARDLT
jgi:hypothetical protein